MNYATILKDGMSIWIRHKILPPILATKVKYYGEIKIKSTKHLHQSILNLIMQLHICTITMLYVCGPKMLIKTKKKEKHRKD